MIMFTAKVKNVKVFENESSASVQITVDKTFKGFALKDDAAVEADINAFSINRSALTAMLCELNDDIALYRACTGKSFDQKQLALILFNAELSIERELKAKGEVYKVGDEERAFEHDCYITNIVGVKLSDKALRLLDAACVL